MKRVIEVGGGHIDASHNFTKTVRATYPRTDDSAARTEVRCHNRVAGQCTIANYLTKHQTNVFPTMDECRACSLADSPRTFNQVTCALAQKSLIEKNLPDIVDCKNAEVHYSALVNRPGSALHQILSKMGIRESVNCDCQSYAKTMDAWGYKGCLERRQEIIEHLNKQSVSWFDMVKVALHGYITTGALVDKALSVSKP